MSSRTEQTDSLSRLRSAVPQTGVEWCREISSPLFWKDLPFGSKLILMFTSGLKVPTSCGRELRCSCRTPEGRPDRNNEQRNPLDLTCVINCWQKRPSNLQKRAYLAHQLLAGSVVQVWVIWQCPLWHHKESVPQEWVHVCKSVGRKKKWRMSWEARFSSVTGDKNCRMIRTLLIWI